MYPSNPPEPKTINSLRMRTKSKTIRLMDRLKRFSSFGGLIAGMTLAASATQYYHINGNPASINADGDLTNDAVDYPGSTKPHTKTEPAAP